MAREIVEAVKDYPLRFVGPGFVAAHAYPFATTFEGFIYGPNDGGVRTPWWEDYELRDHATFFGMVEPVPTTRFEYFLQAFESFGAAVEVTDKYVTHRNRLPRTAGSLSAPRTAS